MSGHLRRRREPLRTWWLNWYVYIVPSILLIAYVMYVLVGVHKYSIPWLGDSEGFSEMCKAIVDFSSIVLGIYGFLIPAVIGRQDKFNKIFWETVDKKGFSKDIQRLIISGMITILLSSGLLIADIFSPKMCAFVVGFLWWFLIFYCCNSIRFVSIFVSLIVEGQSKSDEKESDECQEQSEKHKEIKNRLDNKLPKF